MSNKQFPMDDDKLFSGFILGLFIGGMIAILKAPRIRLPRPRLSSAGTVETSIRAPRPLESAVPTDLIGASVVEGQEAARRRRSELGLNS